MKAELSHRMCSVVFCSSSPQVDVSPFVNFSELGIDSVIFDIFLKDHMIGILTPVNLIDWRNTLSMILPSHRAVHPAIFSTNWSIGVRPGIALNAAVGTIFFAPVLDRYAVL